MPKKDTRIQGFEEHVDAKKQHAVDAKVAELNRQIDSHKNRYKEVAAENHGLLARLGAAGFVEERGVEITPIEPQSQSKEGEAVALGMLSDIHPFTRVRPETVNGKNEYNPDICSKRLTKFFKGFLRLVEIERSGQNIHRAILHLGGDIIGNMIHDELRETNYGTPQEELLFMLENIESGIDFLLKHGKFKEIRVICSHGNHDRDTKRKQYENQAEHALTWTLYHILRRDYALRDKRVTVDIATGYHQILNIFGRKVRFHHGDAVRYHGGVGGPTIPINKAIAAWNTTDPVDLDCMGHWHWSMSDQKFFINGSVCGYTTYALENKFPYEPPRQWFLLLDKKRWITASRYIYLS
jgi:hypothetical protein